MKLAIVLLTWKRLDLLRPMLEKLYKQTYKDFDIIISNGNLSVPSRRAIDRLALYYSKRGLKVRVRNDGNDHYAFRRFYVGKDLYDSGYGIVMFIDDDITIPNTYVEKCISQYMPQTYQSGFTWRIYNRGRNYYKFRKRVFDNDYPIQYAGTGISMMDASIFADPALISLAPPGAYTIEDLWLSYFVLHKRGWGIRYMETPDVIIGGGDSVALYRKVQRDEIDKADFLRALVDMGWNIPATLPKEIKQA